MKVLDKFSNSYYESTFDRSKKAFQKEEEKRQQNNNQNEVQAELSQAAIYFSKLNSEKKVDGVEEAFKLLETMNRYISETGAEGKTLEITSHMNFDTKKIVSFFVS